MLPPEHEPTGRVTNAGHTGFLPTPDVDDRAFMRRTYVRTDRWLARFADAATGTMCERAQQEATKEFADGSPQFTDRQLMYLSIGGGVAGFLAGVLLWGLLL